MRLPARCTSPTKKSSIAPLVDTQNEQERSPALVSNGYKKNQNHIWVPRNEEYVVNRAKNEELEAPERAEIADTRKPEKLKETFREKVIVPRKLPNMQKRSKKLEIKFTKTWDYDLTPSTSPSSSFSDQDDSYYDLKIEESDEDDDENQLITFLLPAKLKRQENSYPIEDWTFAPNFKEGEPRPSAPSRSQSGNMLRSFHRAPSRTLSGNVLKSNSAHLPLSRPTINFKLDNSLRASSSHLPLSRHQEPRATTSFQSLHSVDETKSIAGTEISDVASFAPSQLSAQSEDIEALVQDNQKPRKHKKKKDDSSVSSSLSNESAHKLLEERSRARQARKQDEATTASDEAAQQAKEIRKNARIEIKKQLQEKEEQERQLQQCVEQKKAERAARMEKVRARIAREKEEQLAQQQKENERKKNDIEEQEFSETARRQRAHQWYVRCGMLPRSELIRRIKTLGAEATKVTEEDIDLLPWNTQGTVVNAAKMMKLKSGS